MAGIGGFKGTRIVGGNIMPIQSDLAKWKISTLQLYVQLNEHRVHTKDGKQFRVSVMFHLNGDCKASLFECTCEFVPLG